MFITKFLWIFYFMSFIEKEKIIALSDDKLRIKTKEKEIEIVEEEGKKIEKVIEVETEKEFTLKKAPIWQFLVSKYAIWAIFLLIVYNRYDFYPNTKTLLVWGVGILFGVTLLLTPRKYLSVTSIVLFASMIIALFAYGDVRQISYIFKYTLTMFLLFGFFLDTKKEHFLVYEDDKLRANLIKNKDEIR